MMYGRELAACQLNIKPELNLTWSLQLCLMFYGVGFFISVINEVETVTVLILYKTGGIKCKMGGVEGEEPGLLCIYLSCAFRCAVY